MEELKRWMDDQIVNKKVEENSALGDAIKYCLNHWEKLSVLPAKLRNFRLAVL
jgi:hypothetical protein